MLAELRGKLDPEGSTAVDRSEDLLTDAVFGAFRHLPRRATVALLATVGVAVTAKDAELGRVELWPRMPITRWPGVLIEPDVVVVVGKQPVVFEAKLHSPFHSYHDPKAPAAGPIHQLAGQYAAVREWAAGEKLHPPIVVAVTAPSAPPEQDLREAIAGARHLHPDTAGDTFRWLPWYRIATVLEGLERLQVHERTHVEDVLAFMDRRGVRRVFTGFNAEDYWLVSAAQRVAGDRLYPQIQTFVADLADVLADDEIGWSQPNWRAMWMNAGGSMTKPTDWTRGWIGAAFWPQVWPTRGTKGASLAQYALFDFLEPALEIGLSIPGPGVAAAQKNWSPHLAAVATALNGLPDHYELVVDGGDLARPSRAIPAAAVDADWLTAAVNVLLGTAHLRLRRRSDPLHATVQAAREMLVELRDDLLKVGEPLWDMLATVEYIHSPFQRPEAAERE
ncbi:hypothetical protein [Geodermatophilus sp. FMUSA9-8]|uniref:hypothetical protein n=1 Tax=Geodermatophilus sp. FMUSA9-8 TaxID=3120155 RepID=UPI0030088DD3